MNGKKMQKSKISAIIIVGLAFLGLLVSTYFLAYNLINFNQTFILYTLLVILNMVTILQGFIILYEVDNYSEY